MSASSINLKSFVPALLVLVLTLVPCLGQDLTIRVSETDAKRAAIEKPGPTYPPMARQLKIVGKVEVEVTVDATGNVENVKALSGNPLLTSAVIPTVKKWKFNPFEANGKPVKAVLNLSFDFSHA